jgi:hypothetical protein
LVSIQEQVSQDRFPIADQLPISFLDSHIKKTTNTQIQSIEFALRLADSPNEWWELWYPHVLKKSYLWCENFKIIYTPISTQIASTLTRFPHHADHISRKGAYQL